MTLTTNSRLERCFHREALYRRIQVDVQVFDLLTLLDKRFLTYPLQPDCPPFFNLLNVHGGRKLKGQCFFTIGKFETTHPLLSPLYRHRIFLQCVPLLHKPFPKVVRYALPSRELPGDSDHPQCAFDRQNTL